MGRIIKGVNGGFSGKAGNVVGSSWKSIDYIKGRSKTSNKPASQRQLKQQAKFALAVRFLGQLRIYSMSRVIASKIAESRVLIWL